MGKRRQERRRAEGRSPPMYPAHTFDKIVDHVGDIVIAWQGIVEALRVHTYRPVAGRISINGVESMTTSDVTDIPNDDVPAKVAWSDRFKRPKPGDQIDTVWSAEDADGAASTAVELVEDPADDEGAMVRFLEGAGQFRVVATVGTTRAQSGLFNIVPGAPALGQITINPDAE